MVGNDQAPALSSEDIRRFHALVEQQAGRSRAGWGRGLVLLAVAGALVIAASASAAAGPTRAGKGAMAISSGTLTACYGTKTTVKFLANPTRILDTRDGTGAGYAGTRPGNTTTAVQTSSVLPGAIGVIGNVTVTNGQSGYLTVYPGGTRPQASTINFQPGWNIANHVQSGLAGDGSFQIYNVVPADIIFDATAGIYPVSKGLRLIDPGSESCASGETQTTWNQTGPQGATGPPGVSGWHVVSTASTPVVWGNTFHTFVQCPAGEKVFGGGGQVVGEGIGPFNVTVRESAPGTTGGGTINGWFTSMTNNDGIGVIHNIQEYAVCGFAN
jgi:hypothetical protein